MTKASKNPFGLTHRQCEVMEALVRLGCDKLVADELGVYKTTISVTLIAAMRRMGVKNRVHAAIAWDRAVGARAAFNGQRPPASVFELGMRQ
jgi:DNA-binding NarL/FixJ family response regulator